MSWISPDNSPLNNGLLVLNNAFLPWLYLKRYVARRKRRSWIHNEIILERFLCNPEIKHLRGLPNHGQTCFLNAILQAILSSAPFIVYLHRMRYIPICGHLFELALYIHKFTPKLRIWDLWNVHYHLGNIMRSVKQSGQYRFQWNEQHDAEELLLGLIDAILLQSGLDHHPKSDLNLSVPNDDENGDILSFRHFLAQIDFLEEAESTNLRQENESYSIAEYTCDQSLRQQTRLYLELCQKIPSVKHLIHKSSTSTPTPFSGTILSSLKCSECNYIKQSFSDFLTIPIVPSELSRMVFSQHQSLLFQTCTLQDCLEEFVTEETIPNLNCLSCSVKQEQKRLCEEEILLRDAIEFQSLRKNNDKEDKDSLILSLHMELDEILKRIHSLSSINLDEDYEELCKSKNHSDPALSIPKPLKVEMQKRLCIYKVPSILCIHVKRLYYDVRSRCATKSIQHIQFEEFLDLTPFCDSNQNSICVPCKYRLVSVVVHAGGATSGHYFTYRRTEVFTDRLKSVKNSHESDWLLMSDENVTFVSWDEVSRCQAYMLVYQIS